MALGNKRRQDNSLAKFPIDFPTGCVLPYAGTVAPDGWVLCDGSTYDRTTYASLYGVIGDSNGEGDGSTTFHVPDLRGRFIRGVDNGATRDPDAGSRTAANTGGNTGDAVGAVQDHELESHRHSFSGFRDDGRSDSGGSGAAEVEPQTNNTNYTGGNETRPLNLGLNHIIKL